MNVQSITSQDKIKIKAITNKWMSDNLNGKSKFVSSDTPAHISKNDYWEVNLLVKEFDGKSVGELCVDNELDVKTILPIHAKHLDLFQKIPNYIKKVNEGTTRKFWGEFD